MLGTVLNRGRYAELLHASRRREPRWLQFDRGQMERCYNRLPFAMRHELPSHPAFALDALHGLARRLPDDLVRRRQGAVPPDAHFDRSLLTFSRQIGVDEAFAELERRQLYVVIYNPERDPEYRRVIEELLGEIAVATDPFEHGINWYSSYVFISAAGSLTPYHMDREMNFLLQVRGRKSVQLWDPNDDRVMTPAMRDHLFSWAEDARPAYAAGLDALAHTFELTPGVGVHHPFIAPHLVRTGSELSVSLAITFRTPRSDTWTDAHIFNEMLRRRFGVGVGRVGRIGALDKAKSLALQLGRGFGMRARHEAEQ